jgi:hypothetical protein
MSATPPLDWQALHVPRRGHRAEEYEDAHAADAEAGRFAVADGASETSFAGQWARLLAEGFVGAEAREPDEWVAQLRERWKGEVDELPLPWYAEAKREEGAYATFLGLELGGAAEEGDGTWWAVAVGDACLFQVRDDQLLYAFPLECSGDFDNRPGLLCSRPGKDGGEQLVAEGDWLPGDVFFLMTDALACWFLRECEEGRYPWDDLTGFAGETALEDFARRIEALRECEGLKNDDVTLIQVTLRGEVE